MQRLVLKTTTKGLARRGSQRSQLQTRRSQEAAGPTPSQGPSAGEQEIQRPLPRTWSARPALPLSPPEPAASPQVGQREVGKERPKTGIRHIHFSALESLKTQCHSTTRKRRKGQQPWEREREAN